MALSGALSLPHPDLDGPVPPPGPGKVILGDQPENAVISENFVVSWDSAGDQAAAESASLALEEGWAALVEEEGWAAPVSSEEYLLRVVLVDLGGSGVTTEVDSSLFPEGVPVIYVNPAFASNDDFWRHLCVHEFAHALQFKLRDVWTSTPREAWYCEASAEWQVEQALPELDVYAMQTAYYAWQTQLRFDSTSGSHQYGMVALNAYLEGQWGPGGLREVWEASSDGDPWLDLIGDAEQIWPAFTHAYGNALLPESSLYEPVIPTTLKDGSSGTLDTLGSHYLRAETDTHVRAEGPVLLSAEWLVEGQLLAVTGLEDGSSYTLEIYEPVDTGDGHTGDSISEGDSGIESPRGCGCGGPGSAGILLTLLALGGLRRRR